MNSQALYSIELGLLLSAQRVGSCDTWGNPLQFTPLIRRFFSSDGIFLSIFFQEFSMSAKNVLNWFEVPAVDFQRAVKFYSNILGAEMHITRMGDAEMGFFPMDENDRNSVGGAVVSHAEMKPSTDGTLVYLNGGEDLTSILEKVEPAGGRVVVPKTQITPEIGYFAVFIDTEGNRLGLHSHN